MFNELNRKKVAKKKLLGKCENPIPLKNGGQFFRVMLIITKIYRVLPSDK